MVARGSAFYVRPLPTLGIFAGLVWLARDFRFLILRSERFVADLSSCSFAGSDAGGRELPGDVSAGIFVGWFYEDSRFVA